MKGLRVIFSQSRDELVGVMGTRVLIELVRRGSKMVGSLNYALGIPNHVNWWCVEAAEITVTFL